MAKQESITFQEVLLARFERLQKLSGISQDEFLNAVSLTADDYGAMLSGEDDLTCAYAEHMAEYFGISIFLVAGLQSDFEDIAGLVAAKIAQGRGAGH